jgi:hypothetical protein
MAYKLVLIPIFRLTGCVKFNAILIVLLAETLPIVKFAKKGIRWIYKISV